MLASKTLEQALQECREEWELETLAQTKNEIQTRRKTEAAAEAELERQERARAL